MRDPNAMLLHPNYRHFDPKDKTKTRVFPDRCVREGHEDNELRKGHVISKSTLKLVTNPDREVRVLYTYYDDDGAAYGPAAGYASLHKDTATTAPAFCETCEENFKSADGISDLSRKVDLTRALYEACSRNAHHVVWRLLLFEKKLRMYKPAFTEKGQDILGLGATNAQIAQLAQECLPPLPVDAVPAGTPLEQDQHFRHFTRHYPGAKFQVAVSAEVVLQYENDPTTRTLAFINVVPQGTDRHTVAALSLPRTAPLIWRTILDNSENMDDAEHQLLISNLATRSPDGVCFAPDHFDTLLDSLAWENGIRPNLLENPLPGLTLPVVNITGNNLRSLTNRSFNLFA